MQPNILLTKINQQVQLSLEEDVGHGDISASLVENKQIEARLICREKAILCGSLWFEQCFRQLDSSVSISWSAHDGDEINNEQVVCTISGHAQALLTAERSAINFIQTLSATATTVREYASFLSNTNIKLLDTRKTLPGLRSAQKYAVICGGGYNHRHGLYDGVLLKENHILAAGGIKEAIIQARSKISHGLKIEVEVENLQEVEQALNAQADILLLDNMDLDEIKKVIVMKDKLNKLSQLEVSGNMNEQSIMALRDLDINYISVGALTKNIQSIDFSLRFWD